MSGTPYSKTELALIKRHYPNLNLLVSLMPHRTRPAVTHKAHKMGLTSPPGKSWTLEEERTIRRLHPDVAAIRKALPHRTASAIESRISKLKIADVPRSWTPEGRALLLTVTEKVSDREAAKYLGRTVKAIGAQRLKLGQRRPARKLRDKAMLPFVQDIRDRAANTGTDLGGLLRYLKAEKLKPSLRADKVSWVKVSGVVSALSGELYAEWDD